MMGSAIASGPDRARIAAERAIASPLLEDVDMTGARGVLVNITSSSSLKLKELEEVMECVQFAAEEATVIVGSVFDESMGDEMRVTVVATGLGAPQKHKSAKPEIVYQNHELQRTGTHDEPAPNVNYGELETPAIMRSGRRAAVDAMEKSGVDTYDIPSFLRKQAD
jgi:cell division protein FtsZ